MLFRFDFAVLAGHPSDLTSDLHGMPAVGGGGDVLEFCTIRHSRNASVVRAIPNADIHGAAAADDPTFVQ